LVKSSIGPLADALAHCADGIGSTLVRMSSSNQDGLTGALRLITSVCGLGVVMLTRVSGKPPGT
jgi:hypothetical protein